ncbi:hypothetical protein IU500_34490 [Nocardia terpenica]|uniref:hypothetical protein n=1 Tax=Nocardia terpenica TaxID=455432 RepID=UPI001896279D|nr:hypothetical protein [Nocardia terpenica]MBF6065443.1 hypothetical protein [Nocardia terpenica]MBF6109125.1 hypothetical protein [Nocardia terpenica]MBF6114673.1 hypothetical protein [Nocardia terpenica]MBF6123358.1 hypothetical protein [Nocardia terpenica]MBF6156624.1 hypothetical protein [Nocardia terpenica]
MSSRERKTRKVTVTVPTEVADTLDSWAKSGAIESVSGYVADAVQRRMNRAESLAKLEKALGGRPPLELINRARAARGLPPYSDYPAA